MSTFTPWLKQINMVIIPSYPIGYIVVNGFRGDQVWSKVYVDRSDVPPTDCLKELVESELDKLGSVKNAKTMVTMTDDVEPRVYGGFFLNPGAELQFQLRLAFDGVEHARRMGANLPGTGSRIGQKSTKDRAQLGGRDEFVARMMLSDAAKRFIVQRQLQLANSGSLFCAPMFGWVGISTVGYALMAGLSSVAGPVVGVAVGLSVTLAGFRQFLLGFEQYRIKQADELTVARGDSYVQGAKDYFLSGMKFNRLVRHVLGEEGEQNIAKSGDLLTEPVTYSDRLRNVETFVRKQKAEQLKLHGTASL